MTPLELKLVKSWKSLVPKFTSSLAKSRHIVASLKYSKSDMDDVKK